MFCALIVLWEMSMSLQTPVTFADCSYLCNVWMTISWLTSGQHHVGFRYICIAPTPSFCQNISGFSVVTNLHSWNTVRSQWWQICVLGTRVCILEAARNHLEFDQMQKKKKCWHGRGLLRSLHPTLSSSRQTVIELWNVVFSWKQGMYVTRRLQKPIRPEFTELAECLSLCCRSWFGSFFCQLPCLSTDWLIPHSWLGALALLNSWLAQLNTAFH